MSRIEQALTRAGVGEPVAASAASTDNFVSAWPAIVESEPARAPVAPPSPRELAPEVTRAAGDTPTPVVSFSSAWRDRLATSAGADPVLVEQFRRLAAILHSAQSATAIRVLMVTSASAEDGKTLTALNLSLVLSESYHKRVLLIDADLRRPSLGKAAELTAVPGLSDVLKASVDQRLSFVPVTPTLTLLPAGRPNPDPMGALTSPRMRQILEEAASRFDWVVLDAPPMGPLADARLLADMADAAIFVIRAGRTKHAAVKKAIDTLGRERLLGVVLNGVDRLPAEAAAMYTPDPEV
jgi:capsular exopolysaccharide synthesis family protein